jgi:arylsulfatase A-like enzyme
LHAVARAALMTGRYSIRSGLSLVAVEGTAISLPATEITMAEMLSDAGYATAIFAKWHLRATLYPAGGHLGRIPDDSPGPADHGVKRQDVQ